MKEYKRCKFCSMEIDKSSLKCPHCKKVQASNAFFNLKSENLIILLLIIIGIFTCFNSDLLSLNNLKSFKNNFNATELSQNVINKISDIDDFFRGDYYFYDEDEYYGEDEYYDSYSAYEIAFNFEDDLDLAIDDYNDTSMELYGIITKIKEDKYNKYVYLETSSDYCTLYICIPKTDLENIEELDYYDIEDEICYNGIFHYDYEDEDKEMYYLYIDDGYIE